jgi:hypothetical protein
MGVLIEIFIKCKIPRGPTLKEEGGILFRNANIIFPLPVLSLQVPVMIIYICIYIQYIYIYIYIQCA